MKFSIRKVLRQLCLMVFWPCTVPLLAIFGLIGMPLVAFFCWTFENEEAYDSKSLAAHVQAEVNSFFRETRMLVLI